MIYVVILFAFLLLIIGASRMRRTPLRPLPAVQAMTGAASQMLETGRALHVSFGGSALRDTSTLSALATAEILYSLAGNALLGDKPIITTLSDPITLTLGQDMLRRAYRARNRLVDFQDTQVRWFPQGEQSLAFAAGTGLAITDGDAGTSVVGGRFGAELALLAENAIRTNRTLIAQSDRLDGQAVAYVVSDVSFVGEELYASAAYLSRENIAIGGTIAQDLLRYVVIVIMIVLAVLAFLGVTF
jgi:hypothetical protein